MEWLSRNQRQEAEEDDQRFHPQMAQELGISEKDSDFQNPFTIDRTEVSCWGLLVSDGHGRWFCGTKA